MDEFTNPRCSTGTLDTFFPRRKIVGALRAELSRFRGTVLDVGCGRKPYKSVLFESPSEVQTYIGLDLPSELRHPAYARFEQPELTWNGTTIPLCDNTVDCVIATELFEQCFNLQPVLNEIARVLKTGGSLFFSVPFWWPLHDAPNDQHRYSPFALKRYLEQAGFGEIRISALGGWDASLAQMLALWLRRRSLRKWQRVMLIGIFFPVILWLFRIDRPANAFADQAMITHLTGVAEKISH